MMNLRQKFSKLQSLTQLLSINMEPDETLIQSVHNYLEQPPSSSHPKKTRHQRYKLQDMLYNNLVTHNSTNKLLSSIFRTRKYLVPSNTSNLIKKHILPKFSELSSFQKQFMAYYFLLLRDPLFFSMVKKPQQREEHVLYYYSALMNSQDDLLNFKQIQQLPEEGTFKKQVLQLKCFIGGKITQKDSPHFFKRSKLQQQVQLIIRNLKIDFAREQQVQCYRVDFVVGNKVIEVFGPSHFIPKSNILKGDEEVKKRILQKSHEYLVIGHQEWSGLKGLQDQRQFVSKLLSIQKK